jgi:hypothetical protein
MSAAMTMFDTNAKSSQAVWSDRLVAVFKRVPCAHDGTVAQDGGPQGQRARHCPRCCIHGSGCEPLHADSP